jgi:cytochrome c553
MPWGFEGYARASPYQRSSDSSRIRRLSRLLGALAALAWLTVPGAGSSADLEAGRRKAEVCTSCHGADGNSTIPTVPSLAGQPSLYTYYQLIMFRDGLRIDPQMSPFAIGLSDADMQDIAAYYEAQKPLPPSEPPDPAKMEVGAKLVQTHHCDACHAPGLVGQKHIPRLAGQHYEYLLKQLRAYKAQTHADLDGSMTMAAQPLSEGDIEVLAYYISHLRQP